MGPSANLCFKVLLFEKRLLQGLYKMQFVRGEWGGGISCRSREVHDGEGVSDSGKDFVQQVFGGESEAGCIDAGMTSEVFMIFYHIPVNEETNMPAGIVHKPQNTHRAGGVIQIFFHILRLCKGEPGASDLFGEELF